MGTEETGIYISYLTFGGLGFLLCLLIPYGHYIKSFHDPSSVSTKNSYHFETTDPLKGKISAIPVIKHEMPGSRGSKLLPSGESRFRENLDNLRDRFNFT